MTADMPCTIEVMEALIRHHGEIFPSKGFNRPGRTATLSRDLRGMEFDDTPGHETDDSKRAFARASSTTNSTSRLPSVSVDPYTPTGGPIDERGNSANTRGKREESVTSTMTQHSEDPEEDYETEGEEVPRRPSSNRQLDIEDLRRELELCRANNEALKDTVTQLNLQIEDIKAGVTIPIDATRPKTEPVAAHNYYAMREARVGALKTFANQPVTVSKTRATMSEAQTGSKGSSGQLLASVGRTVNLSPAARSRGSSTMARDLDQYEVVSHLRVRDAPSVAGAEIGVLEVGQKVNCLEIRGIWLKHDAGWSMIQTDPAKEGPRKVFLVLHNPISRRTDRSVSGAVVTADAAGAPINPYAGGLTVSPSLNSSSESEYSRMDPLALPRAESMSRKEDDERVARLKEDKLLKRREALDLKALMGAPAAAPADMPGSPRAASLPQTTAQPIEFVPSF
jgi:hypothetical protein